MVLLKWGQNQEIQQNGYGTVYGLRKLDNQRMKQDQRQLTHQKIPLRVHTFILDLKSSHDLTGAESTTKDSTHPARHLFDLLQVNQNQDTLRNSSHKPSLH